MKTIYVYLIMLSVFAMGACKKALDMAPDGKISLNDVFADNTKVAAFLNSCYDNMPIKGTRYFFWSRGPVEWSDEAWDTDAEAESWIMSGRMYNGDASPGNHPITNWDFEGGKYDYWGKYWNAISNCSVFLSRIDSATVREPADRKRWKAEAHLLRAYYYSELLKWFGPVLPIAKTPYVFTDDFSKIKKESYYDVVKFIMEDCDVALATEELPWRSKIDDENGRVNRAMAEALKSKMILFAASPLYSNGQNHWQEAYEVNKAALAHLKAKGFELYNKVNLPHIYLSDDAYLGTDKNVHTAIYNEYFTQSTQYTDNPIDKETLYQCRENQGNIWDIDGIGAQDGYKSGTCPSQELVDAYETINGEPVLNLANPYADDKHLQPNYNTANKMYDPANPYKNRDPRFYASIYYNGSVRKCWWTFSETPQSYENYPGGIGNRPRIISTYVGEPQTGIHPTTRKATRTGYFERKFLHPNSGNDNPVAGANWKLFRLGEVILNFAEAAAEAGQLGDAVTAVNEIRARAGMPNLPDNLAKDELIRRIRNERRVELAMEENRYFDVRRWSTPSGDLSKTDRWITAMEITRKSDGTFTYQRRTVRDMERKNYTNKFLFVPIPLAEANRLMAITGTNWQNAGW